MRKWMLGLWLPLPILLGWLHGMLQGWLMQSAWWFLPYYVLPIILAVVWFDAGARCAKCGLSLPVALAIFHALGFLSVALCAWQFRLPEAKQIRLLADASQVFFQTFGVFSARIGSLLVPGKVPNAPFGELLLATQCVALIEMGGLFSLAFLSGTRKMKLVEEQDV